MSIYKDYKLAMVTSDISVKTLGSCNVTVSEHLLFDFAIFLVSHFTPRRHCLD